MKLTPFSRRQTKPVAASMTPISPVTTVYPLGKPETVSGSTGTTGDGGVKDDVEVTLRGRYPHGHPDFISITIEEMDLHSRKNADYAEGGDPLGNFRRTESIKRLYPGLDWASDYGGAIDYMLKQVDAVLWSLAHGKDTSCESLDDKLRDISVYAKLVRIMLRAREWVKKAYARVDPTMFKKTG